MAEFSEPDLKPRPDPTLLTTEQLRREINQLSEKFELLLSGVRAQSDIRISDLEKAIGIYAQLRDEKFANLHTQMASLSTQSEQRETAHSDAITVAFNAASSALAQLKDLHGERFNSIELQFKERDTRVTETAKDTSKAVDAALQAAEKAVNKQNESFSLSIDKSEKATMKQIDQLAQNSVNSSEAMDGKIIDVKDRVSRIENQAIGWSNAENRTNTTKTTNNQSTGIALAAVAIIVSLAAIITQIVHFSSGAPK